tara:strand:- start:2901 stop:3881 length:981 start_codon:yes stop_codon:yes gene_type:complete
MKALVTGGAGYIGSTISNYLLDLGHEVTIIDNLSTGSKKNIPKKAHFLKADISDTKKIQKIFLKKNYDVVFHFAAFINNEESIRFPKKYYKNNFLKGKTFFENCIKNKINKFIYSSTAAVYGNKNKRVHERDSLNPMSPYPKSKLKLENYLKEKKNDIRCVILRYFNVAGSDKRLRCGFDVRNSYNLILNLCASSIKKKEFIINGNNYKTKDGTPIRDYIHVEDLAKIHLLAANLIVKKKIFKIFNCGYGYGFSVKEILEKFNLITKKRINFKIGKRRKSDIVISISNPNRLIKYINWSPKYNNLAYILKSSLNWYKKSNKSKKYR